MSFAGKVAQTKRIRLPNKDKPPSVEVCGQLLQFKSGKAFTPPPPSTKGRKINSFSPQARLRLTKTLLTIDYSQAPLSVCITLTYPPLLCPRNKDQRKVDLMLFLRFVNKHLGRTPYGVWRVEWLPRESGVDKGKIAPHIHLLLFGVVFIHYKRINLFWRKTLNYKRYTRTEIKRARSLTVTMKYLAKYITKRGEASLVYVPNWNIVDGKHYGYVRPRSIPRCPRDELQDLTQEQIDYLFEKHHEFFWRSETLPGESFSIMGEHVPKIVELMKEMKRPAATASEIVIDEDAGVG